MALDNIKVISLNARGLNTPEKRRMLLHNLKKSHTDFAFIQEIHFKNDRLNYLQNKFYPLAYHLTNPMTKSKGVSILISSKILWRTQDTLVDPTGRYIFLRGLVGEIQITLATIYAPNENQVSFLDGTLGKLQNFTRGQLILGGDFNVPLIPSADTSSGTSSIPLSHLKRIARTLHRAQLIDIW